jgi:hypothetical protein
MMRKRGSNLFPFNHISIKNTYKDPFFFGVNMCTCIQPGNAEVISLSVTFSGKFFTYSLSVDRKNMYSCT